MKLSKAAAILLLLLIGSAAASAQGSEFTRTFLLETGAL